MGTAASALIQYAAAVRSADKCTSRAYAAIWLKHADGWLVRYLILSSRDPSCWMRSDEPDHRPIDKARWKRKPAF